MTMSGNMSDDKQSSSDEQPCTLSARLIADDTVCDDTIGGYEPLPVMSPLVPTLNFRGSILCHLCNELSPKDDLLLVVSLQRRKPHAMRPLPT
jgi:hypothetical protein